MADAVSQIKGDDGIALTRRLETLIYKLDKAHQ
jgi:hypothetical protein